MSAPPDEEYEFIPWGELAARHRTARPWMLYLVAGAVIVAALGAAAARVFWEPAPAIPAESVPVEVSTTPPFDQTTEHPMPSLYSEADLMAAIPGEDVRAAITRAEWFVTDYFTADAEPSGTEDLQQVLPEGALPDSMPQDDPDQGVSYVEWARAVGVEPLGDGLFRVTVAFRALGAPADGAFRRLPVQAVDVVVLADATGATGVIDLPSPATLGELRAALPVGDEEEAPDEIAQSALEVVSAWGTEAQVLTASRAGSGWRVMASVVDPAGTRWPLVVWMDEAGSLKAPPWELPDGG